MSIFFSLPWSHLNCLDSHGLNCQCSVRPRGAGTAQPAWRGTPRDEGPWTKVVKKQKTIAHGHRNSGFTINHGDFSWLEYVSLPAARASNGAWGWFMKMTTYHQHPFIVGVRPMWSPYLPAGLPVYDITGSVTCRWFTALHGTMDCFITRRCTSICPVVDEFLDFCCLGPVPLQSAATRCLLPNTALLYRPGSHRPQFQDKHNIKYMKACHLCL